MRRSWLLALLCAALLAAAAPARAQDGEDAVEDEDEYEEEERAFLVVKKSCGEEPVVQGQHITVKFELFNAGATTARNVKIVDPELPQELQLVSGSLTASIDSINAGAVETHEYVVVANSAGHFVSPPAKVTYQAESDPDSIQEAVSTIFATAILSPAQKSINAALKMGSYATLGMLQTSADWRNAGLTIGILSLVLGSNWAYTKVSKSASDRRRQRALEELEGKKDS